VQNAKGNQAVTSQQVQLKTTAGETIIITKE
jgi:hypothetical protein